MSDLITLDVTIKAQVKTTLDSYAEGTTPEGAAALEAEVFNDDPWTAWDCLADMGDLVFEVTPAPVRDPDGIVAVDFLGNEIRVGDDVLYPRASGRSVELAKGVVTKIIPFEDSRLVRSEETLRWERVPFTNHKFQLRRGEGSRRFYGGDKDALVTVSIGENVVRAPR